MNIEPNKVTSYIVDSKGSAHVLPAHCAFTHSQAWDTKERRATDSTGTIQNITVMTRRGRQPATVQLSFVLTQAFLNDSIFNALAEYESLVGQNVELIYSNKSFGRCIVENGTFSMSTDYALGVTTLNVALNLKNSIVYTPSGKSGNVKFE